MLCDVIVSCGMICFAMWCYVSLSYAMVCCVMSCCAMVLEYIRLVHAVLGNVLVWGMVWGMVCYVMFCFILL